MGRVPSCVAWLSSQSRWESAGCAMRSAGIAVACVGLALLVGGCDPNDRTYFREGIGTELYTADTATATELQNVYLDYLCRQSSSYVGADAPSCSQVVQANVWPVIVQAGMNDIDARCDSYLAWLDQKKRENAGILTEIGAVRFAVDALTNPAVVTGVSPVALAAISAAFGLATSTVNNFNSLLLQVDHTTVQSVVFNNRHDFRESLVKFSSAINNKPLAIHTLRTYLTICMPMTIAANINSTVTVFQETGFVGSNRPFSPTIGAPFAPREKFTERKPPPGPEDKLPTVPGAAAIIDGYPGNARTYTPEVIANILSALCAPESESKGVTVVAKTLFDIWEHTDLRIGTPKGKIDNRERGFLQAMTACPTDKVLNAFERQSFLNETTGAMKSTKRLSTLLDTAPPATDLAGGGIFNRVATLQEARPRIAQLRRDCFQKLKKLPNGMTGQVTRDFMDALQEYSDKRDAATPPAAGQPATPSPLPAC
jgi:hypothetical protein